MALGACYWLCCGWTSVWHKCMAQKCHIASDSSPLRRRWRWTLHRAWLTVSLKVPLGIGSACLNVCVIESMLRLSRLQLTDAKAPINDFNLDRGWKLASRTTFILPSDRLEEHILIFFTKSFSKRCLLRSSVVESQIHSDHTSYGENIACFRALQLRHPRMLVPKRKVWQVGEQQWNPPCGYGAGLRPLGYYAAKNCTLLAQKATHQINLLLIIHPLKHVSIKNYIAMPTLAEVSDK